MAGLKIKTNAGARLTAALATGEDEVSVSSADVARFPSLTDVGTAADVSDAHVSAGTAKDYFHAVIQYETLTAGDRTNERAGWREYVRVWKVAADRLHIVRDITGETNTHDGNWDIEEGEVVTITETLLATDLPVLAGQLRGEYAGGDNVELGTAAARVGQVRAKNADFSVQAMIGDRVLKAGTGQVDPASPTLFLPRPDGATDAKNTLATRGDNITEGCHIGTLCIAQDAGSVENYPLTGGEFGDAVTIVRWIALPTMTRFKLLGQDRDQINTIFGDFTDAGNNETQTTLIINSITHVVRHVVFENAQGQNGPFVTMEGELPTAVTLEDFREHMSVQSTSYFAKVGTLTTNKFYADEAVINHVVGLGAGFQFIECTRRFSMPVYDTVPTENDDVDSGAKVGEIRLSRAGLGVHVCIRNDAGAASWGRIQMTFPNFDVMFESAGVRDDRQYEVERDENGATRHFGRYAQVEINGVLFDPAPFIAGQEIVVGNKRLNIVPGSTYQFTVRVETQTSTTYSLESRTVGHPREGNRETYLDANTRDVTDRYLIIKGLR